MRYKKETANSPRQVWCYDGRRTVDGGDCYVWKRHLEVPEPVTGYTTLAYAHPVESFWP